MYIYIGADDSETETDEERREIQAAMEKASKEKAILLQYRDAIKAATEIGLDYTTLNPEELISMFMAGELDPTHQEEARQNVKCGKGGKGGKGGRPKGQSQKRVHEYDKAREQYEEDLYDKELAERELRKDLESRKKKEREIEKQKEREVEGDTSRERTGEVVLKIDITDSDGEEDSEETAGDSIQPGDRVVHRKVPAYDATEKPDSESGTSGKQETHTYYVQVKEKINITQKKKHQLETIIKYVLQSRPEDITVQDVNRQEEGEDEGEVDDCITEHITHISRASTTEGCVDTTDAASTEGFVDPTSTEEYMESSFEEKNTAEKQSELAVMKQKDVPSVLKNKDLRKMVLEKAQEKKRRERELALELQKEKGKQEEIQHQWRVFMHSDDELKEMEARERQKKEKEKVDAVKRKLQFEQSQREEEQKKKEKEHKIEREGSKRKAKERKQKKPRKHQVEVVSLFSSDEEPAAKKGIYIGYIYIYIYYIYTYIPCASKLNHLLKL